jgi:hypothetical protein
MVSVRHSVQVSESLGSEACEASMLLTRIQETLASSPLQGLLELIDTVITEDAAWSRSAQQRTMQECFAVRPGQDGHLDATRRVSTSVCECMNSSFFAYRCIFKR